MLRHAGIETAGSLRIETFEGSRLRLRRTREGYGRSIDERTSGSANLKPSIALGKACKVGNSLIIGAVVLLRANFGILFGLAADAEHTSGSPAVASEFFDDERLL